MSEHLHYDIDIFIKNIFDQVIHSSSEKFK